MIPFYIFSCGCGRSKVSHGNETTDGQTNREHELTEPGQASRTELNVAYMRLPFFPLPSRRDTKDRTIRTKERGRGTQRQYSENICSEDDLRSRIFGIFVVKFLACLPLLGFSNI